MSGSTNHWSDDPAVTAGGLSGSDNVMTHGGVIDWTATLSFDDIYSDANGQRAVLAPWPYGPPPMTALWAFSGSLGGGAGDCGYMMKGLVVHPVVVNTPSFSLDREGEQHFTINSAEVCQSIRTVLYFRGHQPPEEELSCTADVEWTIEVTRGAQGT